MQPSQNQAFTQCLARGKQSENTSAAVSPTLDDNEQPVRTPVAPSWSEDDITSVVRNDERGGEARRHDARSRQTCERLNRSV